MQVVEPGQFPLSPVDGGALSALTHHLEAHLGREDVIEDVYPLSPVQQAMLFHAIAADADDLYVIQQRLALDGKIDIDVLRRAWSLVVARHPALRTSFAWQHKGRPAQVVCREVDVSIAGRL